MIARSQRLLLAPIVVSFAFAFAVAAPQPSLAASFSFQYSFGSGDVLEGMFDGDLQLDGDNIYNVSNVVATFNGIGLNTPLIVPGRNRASLSGVVVDLYAGEPAAPPLLGFFGGDSIQLGVHCFTGQPSGILCLDRAGVILGENRKAGGSEMWNPAHWSAMEKVSAPVPEPTAAILFSAGTLIVGGALRRSK
jgi:hypothetical protein